MFWLVWNADRTRVPMFVHRDEQSARMEAERLAKAHGGKFFVLQSIAMVEKNDVQWTEIDETFGVDIPF